jgi:hypothetical protein
MSAVRKLFHLADWPAKTRAKDTCIGAGTSKVAKSKTFTMPFLLTIVTFRPDASVRGVAWKSAGGSTALCPRWLTGTPPRSRRR